ncbi:hypothetical protein VTO42DRAFT_5850 [Malbranchea cinnamomea]
MPPKPLDQDTAPVEQLSLTDQDVEILHQIIIRAEQHPDVERLPFRAIFAAYDAVLSEKGIEAEKDRIYLRFLFLLGDRGVHGEGLYAKFEALLAQLGILLEYSDGAGEECNRPAAAKAEGDDATSHTGKSISLREADGINRRKHLSRRASFNSVYDLTTDATQRSANRPSSRFSESKLDGIVASSGPPIQENTLLHAAVEHPQALRELARRLLAGEFQGRNELHSVQANGIRKSIEFDSPPQQRPHPRRRHSHSSQTKRHETTDDEDFADESELPLSDDSVVVDRIVPSEFFYQPSLSHLLRDASIFNSYRQRNAARRIFRRWLELAKRSQQNSSVMEQIALRHDQSTLLRQALDLWRACLQQKRQDAQTERFFRHLEERAARARDLYLLTKVFTHWSQIASEERAKTSAARKHILCVKYFNAWRELTAVNELKIQRFTLKKPFNVWIGRVRHIQRNGALAAELYDRSLSKQFYWCWFWAFCYQRAPQWREYRLKQRFLVTWLRNFRALREREHDVDISRKQGLLQCAFQLWSQRAIDISLAEKNADNRLRTKLLRDNFTEWRIQRYHRSAAAQVTNLVTSRILLSTFNTWALRTRMEIQAREVDRARILRNAWTVWNDRLRYQALAARIDERIVMQALYKWVLMERFRLMTRVHQQRQKRDILQKLTMNSRGLYTHLLRREEEFRARRTRELLRQKFSLWRKQLEVQRHRDLIAHNFYAPRVELEALDLWKSQHAHVAKMEGWAKDARFYFLAMKTIKRWKAATHDSAKRRRDSAYIFIRRKVKINLVTAALTSWRSRTSHIVELERQADEMRLRTLLRQATDLFDIWVRETRRRVEQIRDAETYYNRQLVYNSLAHWTSLSRVYQAQLEKAEQALQVHISRVAAAQLRKLSLRIFQIRTSFETADAQNDRSTRKHLKAMLRRWSEKAQEVRISGATHTQITTTPAAPPPAAFPLNVLDEENEWHPTDGMLHVNELLSQPNSTPHTPMPTTPGYLSTPSKRAARARALARASTTPATPQRTPFAARLLARSHTTDPRGSSVKKGFVPRSGLGTTVRFAVEDEEPESPTEGRRSFRNPS